MHKRCTAVAHGISEKASKFKDFLRARVRSHENSRARKNAQKRPKNRLCATVAQRLHTNRVKKPNKTKDFLRRVPPPAPKGMGASAPIPFGCERGICGRKSKGRGSALACPGFFVIGIRLNAVACVYGAAPRGEGRFQILPFSDEEQRKNLPHSPVRSVF